MKQRIEIIFTILFLIYVATILLTELSLSGFWTDVIVSIFLSVYAIWLVFKSKLDKKWLYISVKLTNLLCSLVVFGAFGLKLLNPFALDTFKLHSFYFLSVDNRLFNAYFKPVGSYSGGYGCLWIAETPRYFPLIEWNVHYHSSVHHDYNDDVFDGERIDNSKLLIKYIQEEVVEK